MACVAERSKRGSPRRVEHVTDPVLSAASYTPSISEQRGTATTFLHSGLKNADVQTSSSGSVSGTRVYDACGAELASTGSWQGAFGYAGGFGYQEDANGFKLLGHRYYDPSTGRFLTRDPIKDGRNWYAYCRNNPVSRLDSTGLVDFELPRNPSFLPEGWWKDPNHGGGGKMGHERWFPPVEKPKNGLEWHPRTEGVPESQWRGRDHWHRTRLLPGRDYETEKAHIPPGEIVELDLDPAEALAEPELGSENMWDYVDWGEVSRRVAIFAAVVGLAIVIIGSFGLTSVPAGATMGILLATL